VALKVVGWSEVGEVVAEVTVVMEDVEGRGESVTVTVVVLVAVVFVRLMEFAEV
jgi:hypothetical protein